MKKVILGVAFVIAFVACGTHLSAVSLRDEQAGLTVSAAGYRAHPNDTDPDNVRYGSLWCKGREVILQGGGNVADAGIPCR